MSEQTDRTLRIDATDAVEHGLPPIGFDLDLSDSGMVAIPFAVGGNYLTLRGPPGRTLVISIDHAGSIVDRAMLEAAYRSSAGLGASEALTGTMTMGGEPRDAILRVAGEGFGRYAQCTALVRVPEHGGLLVTLLVGIGPSYQPSACDALLEEATVAAFAATFRVH